MTYTEAARINSQFNLKWYFKDPKQTGDGVHLKWFKDPQGRIGYVSGCNSEAILVMYPVQSLKNHVRLLHSYITHEDWKTLEKL